MCHNNKKRITVKVYLIGLRIPSVVAPVETHGTKVSSIYFLPRHFVDDFKLANVSKVSTISIWLPVVRHFFPPMKDKK